MNIQYFRGTILIAFIIFNASLAHSQRTTEMYIPIGQSPGLSGKNTLVGFIRKVDAKSLLIVIGDAKGDQQVKVTKGTKIWLDRSQLKLTNQEGTLADCKENILAEVKPTGGEKKDQMIAEWIKVQISEIGPASEK